MDWIVLMPPLLAIVLAIWTRQVYLSLLAGLWLGTTTLQGGNPLAGLRELADQMVLVFSDPGNTRVIFFCVLIGSLVALVQASGGVLGFVRMARDKGWGRSRRGAELLAWGIGMLIFVESSITSLVVGSVSRPLFDNLKLAREKLAFYCDATSAPVCMTIPLNGWGAYVLGLLAAQGVSTGAVSLLAGALLLNFFCLLAIVFSVALAITGFSFGPMKSAERRAREEGAVIRPGSRPLMSEDVASIDPKGPVAQARDLIIPVTTMVLMIFVALYITGDGNITQGSGSEAVLWAVGTAIIVAVAMYAVPRGGKTVLAPSRSLDFILKGLSGMVSVTLLIILAFALGQVSRALEMGPYVVGMIGEDVPSWWIPAVVFIVGCVVSFTLGSSWTTFAIMIPVAIPMAEGLDLAPSLMLAAVLSGGVFGDYCSPLSDTSIISSMASACDHMDHVNTQLPYALALAGVSALLFLLAGMLL